MPFFRHNFPWSQRQRRRGARQGISTNIVEGGAQEQRGRQRGLTALAVLKEACISTKIKQRPRAATSSSPVFSPQTLHTLLNGDPRPPALAGNVNFACGTRAKARCCC